MASIGVCALISRTISSYQASQNLQATQQAAVATTSFQRLQGTQTAAAQAIAQITRQVEQTVTARAETRGTATARAVRTEAAADLATRNARRTVAAGEDILYSQAFDTAPEWEWADDEVTWEVRGGKLRADIKGSVYAWTMPGEAFNAVKIDVDVQKVSGIDNNLMGVICHARDVRHFYAFIIGSDQFFAVMEFNDGDETYLSAWKTSSDIHFGTVQNHLTVTCDGSQLTMEVNGAVLFTGRDSTYSRGDVGLVAGSFEDGETVNISFDNFVVTPP